MSILTVQDFVGEANIPDTDSQAVAERLQVYIDKYEQKYLRALLGLGLYTELKDGLLQSPIPDKWVDLVAQFNEPLTYYVYWHWLKGNNDYTNNSGVSRKKNENSEMVSPMAQMVSRWNNMVEANWDMVKGWDSELYGDYYFTGSIWPNRDVRDIFTKQNTFNL